MRRPRRRSASRSQARPLPLVLAVVGAVVAGAALGIGAAWISGPGDEVAAGPDYPAPSQATLAPDAMLQRPDPRAPTARLAVKPGTVIETPALVVPQTAPQQAALPPVPENTVPALPAWRANAVPVALEPGVPKVAVVIDDLGIDHVRTARALRLPAPVTMAFLSYGNRLAKEATAARAAGHELLVHVPMEPEAGLDPGPNVLRAGDGAQEIRSRLDWALARFPGFVGINNHMGSRFTADAAAMDVVAAELKRRGLLFVDSRTTKETKGYERARVAGVPAVSRDVFLDREATREAVDKALAELEARARKHGQAIAIGHPYDATLDALDAWLPTLRGKGLQLVPVSALVQSGPASAPGR